MSLPSSQFSSLLSCLLLSASALWGQLPEGDGFPVRSVSERFHIIESIPGAGSNVGVLVGDEGVLLVDAMMEGSYERLVQTVRRLSPLPITHVISTHGDADHTGGNAALVERGALVLAQENVLYRSPRAYPIETFGHRHELELYDETITRVAIRSHAPDDTLVFLERTNVILLGDAYTNVWHPTFYTGGIDGQLAVLDAALGLADDETIVVPGHGLPSDRQGLRDYRDRCLRWHHRVAELVESGASEAVMLRDPELLRLRAEFNLRHSESPIPEASFRRFLRRTISTDFLPAVPLVDPPVEAYLGSYRYEDGVELHLSLENERIVGREPQSDFYELIPVAHDRFRVRGSNDEGRFVSFQIDDTGRVTGATFVSDGARYEAVRTASRPVNAAEQ